jgi:hypothetical protein
MQISFAHFYASAKNGLNFEQLRALDPSSWYFSLKGGFVGLRVTDDGEVWIDIAVGSGTEWMRDLAADIDRAGFKKVRYFCRPDSPSVAFCRYWKGTMVETEEKYSDGAKALLCELVLDNKRLRHGTNP